jgi:hypothetical protein
MTRSVLYRCKVTALMWFHVKVPTVNRCAQRRARTKVRRPARPPKSLCSRWGGTTLDKEPVTRVKFPGTAPPVQRRTLSDFDGSWWSRGTAVWWGYRQPPVARSRSRAVNACVFCIKLLVLTMKPSTTAGHAFGMLVRTVKVFECY